MRRQNAQHLQRSHFVRIYRFWKMRGVGLVELMVSLLLGALLTAGIVALFNANRQTFRLQDNVTRTQENGSFALDFLTEDLRMAGYPGLGFNALGVLHQPTTLNDQQQTVDRNIGGAVVAVDYFDDQLTTIFEPGPRSSEVTCTGDAIPAGTEYAGNRYWVREVAAGGNRELVCQGVRYNAAGAFLGVIGTAQALADGVESFQVLYGIDTTFGRNTQVDSGCPPAGGWPAADARIDQNDLPTQYVAATALAAAFAAGAAAPECGRQISPIAMVRAIRIGLLVRTEDVVNAQLPAGQAYTVLDRTLDAGNFAPLADGRIRRLFTATVALRNAAQEIVR